MIAHHPKQLSDFFRPADAAAHLGGSQATLGALLRKHALAYTDLSPEQNAKPWGRGRKTWGLTAEQLQAVKDHCTRRHATPTEATPRDVLAKLPGHDGKSRLRRRGRG